MPAPLDPADWRDPRVGWGLILPERPGLEPSALATADDAPEPIRALVAARGGRVLRYRAGARHGSDVLRDYAGGGDLLGAASPPGSGPRQLPMYLLIYATPAEIPWSLQYALNPVRNVGRLDLTGDGLANYVTALHAGWPGSAARYDAPVVWAVDFGPGDITALMRDAIAAPVAERFGQDADMKAGRYVDGSAEPATAAVLAETLRANTPALVVTTSHGMTGPLDDAGALRANLGRPVDTARAALDPDALLAAWQPDGAIWYAHACCSAGVDTPSAYHGLFDPASTVARVLDGVTAAGPMVAPLPRALLGAAKPLRAFVGHVEPAFDWTLSFPPNRQVLTADLVAFAYQRLCSGTPVGLAASDYYRPIASLLIRHGATVKAYSEATGDASTPFDMALYTKVTAYDRASMVILGDPTATIPTPR